MTIADAIKRVVAGQDLSAQEAEEVLEQIMTGECGDAQIGSLLTALRMKGETVDELVGFARVMRRKVARVEPAGSAQPLIDTCGTGGDASGSFNVSTAVAFVAAGAGLRVAKHGNRAVSSSCGSADVMEKLGVKIELPLEQLGRCIEQVGIGFLFAPALHPAMKHVAPVRKQLGIRTIFNMLGPVTNPAAAPCQLVGVYAKSLPEMLARVLRELGSRHVLVVHGSDGMDEITITGESTVAELRDGELSTYRVRPEDFGIAQAPAEAIRGGDARQNADIIRRILEGERGPRRDIVLMNAAAALVAGDRAPSLREGIELAKEAIDSGRAREKLDQLVAFSNGQR